MKYFKAVLTIILSCLWFGNAAFAHFGMVIPSDSMVAPDDSRSVTIDLSFSHPMEMIGMPMERPKHFGVVYHQQTLDLTKRLEPHRIMGQDAWTMNYPIRRPGAYLFFMEPAPYWEPAEDCFIIHYTKTVIAAFGDDEGWDREIGLKTEIAPLARPLGLYAGNAFQGVVKVDGKAVPFAMVEIEFYNKNKSATAPDELMTTQSIKADQNGVFTYVPPSPGWWGFAALNTADFMLEGPNGQKKSVEIGAVIWVHFETWPDK